jgi:glycosyltransferase involved in cell wall biosynthesis
VALSVSTVIPTYNRAHFVRRAVDSALGQSRPEDEVIVVDDGSTDDTAAVLAPYGDRIRYVRTANGGGGAARNVGVRHATRDLVAFLDSDDEWIPGKLELARRWLEARPDVLYVFSEFAMTDHDGSVTRRYLINWHNDPRSWNEILAAGVPYSAHATLPDGVPDFLVHTGSLYERQFARGYILTSAFVVRRQEAGDALHFGDDIPAMEDLECFGRVSRVGPGSFFDYETAWQHGHAGDRISSTDHLPSMAANILVLERVWGADARFMATHGAEYRRVLDDLRMQRTRIFLVQGRVSEARAELAAMERPPTSVRLLTSLPGPIVRGALALRRRLSSLAGGR